MRTTKRMVLFFAVSRSYSIPGEVIKMGICEKTSPRGASEGDFDTVIY